MPVSILTLHAYRSWMPDHPRGYVKRGEVLPPSEDAAARYRQNATQDRVRFTPDILLVLHSGALDIAQRRGWRIHAVFGETTHLHLVVSWQDETSPQEMRRVFANLLSKFLGEHAGVRGKRWFARRPSCKPVRDRTHLAHLVGEYREQHRALRWREGAAPPPPLHELLKPGLR